ncbi:MAG: 50S ribosomal protein L25 [Syntrophales bacterium]|nr:50S ribosomal protein L25 [Syntrophales bacterium]
MDIKQLKAFIRKGSGKGVARKLRTQGFVPAILYGPNSQNELLYVSEKDLKKLIVKADGKFFIKLMIDVNGKTEERLTLIKDYTIHPFKPTIMHADFYRIDPGRKINVALPVKTTGTSPGVVRGGELQILKREILVSCSPSDMPGYIEVDIGGLDVGDSVKARDIKVPEGVTIREAGNIPVIYIAPTRASLKSPGESAAQPTKK